MKINTFLKKSIIVISILFCLIPNLVYAANDNIIVTEYKSKESAQYLWDTLNEYTHNEYITAGIMGYFWRESKFRSDAVAGWPTLNQKYNEDFCIEFTEKIDKGLLEGTTKELFVFRTRNNFGGYGLGQWYSVYYLEAFYDFAQEWGTSIGDAEMQCAFVVWSLEHQTPKVWKYINKTKDAEKVGRDIGLLYDGSELGYEYIGVKAQYYYDKYHS